MINLIRATKYITRGRNSPLLGEEKWKWDAVRVRNETNVSLILRSWFEPIPWLFLTIILAQHRATWSRLRSRLSVCRTCFLSKIRETIRSTKIYLSWFLIYKYHGRREIERKRQKACATRVASFQKSSSLLRCRHNWCNLFFKIASRCVFFIIIINYYLLTVFDHLIEEMFTSLQTNLRYLVASYYMCNKKFLIILYLLIK